MTASDTTGAPPAARAERDVSPDADDLTRIEPLDGITFRR